MMRVNPTAFGAATMVLALLSYGVAVAQPAGTSAPASAPSTSQGNAHEESIVVPGARMRAAPTPHTNPGPQYVPQGSAAATPQPSIMPHSHCNTALQNDVGGQPATSQTLTTTGCQ